MKSTFVPLCNSVPRPFLRRNWRVENARKRTPRKKGSAVGTKKVATKGVSPFPFCEPKTCFAFSSTFFSFLQRPSILFVWLGIAFFKRNSRKFAFWRVRSTDSWSSTIRKVDFGLKLHFIGLWNGPKSRGYNRHRIVVFQAVGRNTRHSSTMLQCYVPYSKQRFFGSDMYVSSVEQHLWHILAFLWTKESRWA